MGVESDKKKTGVGRGQMGAAKKDPRGAWSLPQKLTSSLKEIGCGCVLGGRDPVTAGLCIENNTTGLCIENLCRC